MFMQAVSRCSAVPADGLEHELGGARAARDEIGLILGRIRLR